MLFFVTKSRVGLKIVMPRARIDLKTPNLHYIDGSARPNLLSEVITELKCERLWSTQQTLVH
jgi:hypothetical protein